MFDFRLFSAVEFGIRKLEEVPAANTFIAGFSVTPFGGEQPTPIPDDPKTIFLLSGPGLFSLFTCGSTSTSGCKLLLL